MFIFHRSLLCVVAVHQLTQGLKLILTTLEGQQQYGQGFARVTVIYEETSARGYSVNLST